MKIVRTSGRSQVRRAGDDMWSYCTNSTTRKGDGIAFRHEIIRKHPVPFSATASRSPNARGERRARRGVASGHHGVDNSLRRADTQAKCGPCRSADAAGCVPRRVGPSPRNGDEIGQFLVLPRQLGALELSMRAAALEPDREMTPVVAGQRTGRGCGQGAAIARAEPRAAASARRSSGDSRAACPVRR